MYGNLKILPYISSIQTSQTNMNKVALYIRVSGQTQTVENQRIRLIEYAENNEYTYDIYEETESTRKTRPVKQMLLSKLRNKNYYAVVVYKLDRWARSSMELILDTKELLDKNIGFISVSDNLDFTMEGLRRAKMQGKIPGRPKGSKDSKKRRKSGYILREANKRKMIDQEKGINKSIETYLN